MIDTHVFDILKYGANGNGKTLNTKAIQTAIDDCNRHGGGMVYIPPGDFVSGTLRFRSNITLYLEAGATSEAARGRKITNLSTIKPLGLTNDTFSTETTLKM